VLETRSVFSLRSELQNYKLCILLEKSNLKFIGSTNNNSGKVYSVHLKCFIYDSAPQTIIDRHIGLHSGAYALLKSQ
jgi:hypothetical protein